MTIDEKETSPKSSSRVLIPILFAAVLIFCLIIIALRVVHNIKGELLVYWDDGLKICSASDGPFVVTHLYASGAEGLIVVAFDLPIAIIDSAGRYFTKEKIDKMKWESYLGEPTNPPSVSDDIKVLYYIPQQKQSHRLR
jgi:hypothetical protein